MFWRLRYGKTSHFTKYVKLERSEVVTAVKMSMLVFWVVTRCGLIGIYNYEHIVYPIRDKCPDIKIAN
jgi:hypothetical protein